MPDLRPLFSPNSIAIVGASADAGSLRGRLTRIAIEHGYEGRLFLVSRRESEVLGEKTYPRVAALPQPVDLAILLVPAAHVTETLEECGRLGMRAAVVISSGFAEEKGEAAEKRDKELREIARRYDLLLCGPNSEGIVNPFLPLVATFSPVFHDPSAPLLPQIRKSRTIAVSCQSGALTFAFLSRGRARGLAFGHQVSAGNQAVLEAHDYVDWLCDQAAADIFLLYLEGIREADRFRAVAEKAAEKGKPLIIATVGRSEAARRAARSHTGSLARAGAVEDAVFRHLGIVRGKDLDQMLDIAAAFAFCPLPRGNRVAVITGSGGSAVWMADILAAHGLELPVLEEDLQKRLLALLPSYASAQNPVDGTAQAIQKVGYARLIEIVRESERIDTILLIASLANEETAHERAVELAEITGTTRQPILLSTYTTASAGAMAAFAEVGIPCYTSMPSCARAIRALVDYAAFQEERRRRVPPAPTDPALRAEIASALAAGGPVLTEVGAKTLLSRYGVPSLPERLAASEAEAVAVASEIGGPVALKVISPDIPHKTEAGAVALGVTGETALREAYRQILARTKAALPQARIDGVLVQKMAAAGREMILGIVRNPNFGPILMAGLGGIHAEALADTVFAPVPIDEREALRLLASLKGAALLGPFRGAPAADTQALARLMAALSRFAADHAEILAEIDLNPVIVHAQGEGLSVVDGLIVKREPEPAERKP